MMAAGHSVERCKICFKMIRQCRCPGPHVTEWTMCAACAVIETANQMLAHSASQKPYTPELPNTVSLVPGPVLCVCTVVTLDIYANGDTHRLMLLVKHKQVGWQWPGGKVDPGELLVEAAARELREEAGLELPPHRFTLLSIHQGDHGPRDLPFVCMVYHANVDPFEASQARLAEPDKFDQLSWFQWGNLPPVPDMFNELFRLLVGSRFPSYERHKQINTHCFHCNGRIPCRCMIGNANATDQWPGV